MVVGNGSGISQCMLEWTIVGDLVALAISGQQFLGTPGQHATNFASLSFDAGNRHRIVGGCLMSHPGDDGCFGALLDRDPLGACHGSTADGCRMVGNGARHSFRQIAMTGMEIQISQHGIGKVFDIFDLSFLASLGVGLASLRVGFGGAFGFQIESNLGDSFGGCPKTFGKGSPPFLLLQQPMIARRLDTASQCGITGWTESLTRWNRQQASVRCLHGLVVGPRQIDFYVHV